MKAINKEQVVFLCAILLCAWLVYEEMEMDRSKMRKRRVRTLSSEAPDLSTRSGALLGADEVSWDGSKRNIYLAPTEESPLPPIVLPPPPLGVLPTTSPQPIGGVSPYFRLGTLAVIEPAEDVALPPRAGQAAFEALLGDEGESEAETSTKPTVSTQEKSDQEEDKKVLGFRDRLKKKKLQQVQEARAEAEAAAQEAERKKSLDRITWINGSMWYGRITNDAETASSSESLDRFALKLRIDAIRGDTNLSLTEVAQLLASKDLYVRFQMERSDRPGVFGAEQSLSAAQIRTLTFAQGAINQFQIRRRQVAMSDLAGQLEIADELMDAGEFAMANAHLKRLADQHSNGGEDFYLSHARASRQSFDYDTELRVLVDGLKKFPSSAKLNAELGSLYSRYDLGDLAERAFEGALSKGRNARVSHMYGRHIMRASYPGKDALVKASNLLKGAVSRLRGSPEHQAEAHTDHGRALLAAGEARLAAQSFDAALRVNAAHLDAQVGLGGAQFVLGELGAAKAAFDAALQTSPECGAAWYGIGLCELAASQWARARDRFYDAMLADPLLTAECNYALSSLYERIGKMGDALDAASAALLAEPSHAMASFQKGRILLQGGDALAAHDLFHVAMAQLPNEFNIISHLADACFQMQRYEDCLRYIERALELHKNADFLLIRRAHVLARLNRFPEAKTALDLARKLQTGDEVDLSLAFYYYSSGNSQEALKRFGDVVRSLNTKDHRPIAEYARHFEATIRDNRSMRSWDDSFNRLGKEGITRGWEIYAAETNVRPSLVRGRVSFKGVQKESGRPTCIFQERNGSEFVSFEAKIVAVPTDGTTVAMGLFQFREARRGASSSNPIIGKTSGAPAYSGVILGKTPEGRIGYRTVEKGELSRWTTLSSKRWPAPTADGPTELNLRIVLSDLKKRLFSLYAGDELVAEGLKLRDLLQSRRKLQLWLFTQSEIDTPVSFAVDDVRIVTRKGVR